MGKRVAPVRQPTSQAGRSDSEGSEDGFTLLEAICVIAILAILAVVILPRFPHGTTRARLESYAVATASLLKTDRDAAVRLGRIISAIEYLAFRISHRPPSVTCSIREWPWFDTAIG